MSSTDQPGAAENAQEPLGHQDTVQGQNGPQNGSQGLSEDASDKDETHLEPGLHRHLTPALLDRLNRLGASGIGIDLGSVYVDSIVAALSEVHPGFEDEVARQYRTRVAKILSDAEKAARTATLLQGAPPAQVPPDLFRSSR